MMNSEMVIMIHCVAIIIIIIIIINCGFASIYWVSRGGTWPHKWLFSSILCWRLLMVEAAVSLGQQTPAPPMSSVVSQVVFCHLPQTS